MVDGCERGEGEVWKEASSQIMERERESFELRASSLRTRRSIKAHVVGRVEKLAGCDDVGGERCLASTLDTRKAKE
jgi:hypothetical protein